MGLKSDIQGDLADAFDSDLADVIKTINLVKITDSYNTDTGLNEPTETSYPTRGVLDAYKSMEVFDTSIEPADIKAIILTNELDATPEIDDYIEYGTIRYKILAVNADPADAHWELKCRL